jgi:hypothetical protein
LFFAGRDRHLGYSPINLPILSKLLSVYPDREAADILYNGFRYGFRINYAGPTVPYESRNLKSVLNNPAIAWEKVMHEVNAGRIAGPFFYRPISNVKIRRFMRLEPLISHTGILMTFYLSIILDLQNFFH